MIRKHLLSIVFPVVVLSAWQTGSPGGDDSSARPTASSSRTLLADDFEGYRVGGIPTKWKFIDGRRKLVPVSAEIMSKEEYFVVEKEEANKFLRAVTMDRAHRVLMTNEDLGNWDTASLPYLRWDWRAIQLPKGAREDREKLNDSGAAVYVTFSQDWLGRPRSIKYSYSSTLPVGTVVDFGRLKVVVAASGKYGNGDWNTIERNVVEDYRRYFGGEAPRNPVSVMLWSDSNSVHGKSVVDFDNIILSSSPGPAHR